MCEHATSPGSTPLPVHFRAGVDAGLRGRRHSDAIRPSNLQNAGIYLDLSPFLVFQPRLPGLRIIDYTLNVGGGTTLWSGGLPIRSCARRQAIIRRFEMSKG